MTDFRQDLYAHSAGNANASNDSTNRSTKSPQRTSGNQPPVPCWCVSGRSIWAPTPPFEKDARARTPRVREPQKHEKGGTQVKDLVPHSLCVTPVPSPSATASEQSKVESTSYFPHSTIKERIARIRDSVVLWI